MLLRDICTNDVVTCGRDTTLLDVARLLRNKHTGNAVVVDSGTSTPAGLVTDRDIVVKVIGAGLNPAKVTAGQIMRTPLIVAGDSEDSRAALDRMRAHGVRRLPVTAHDGGLAGIVTLDDLLRLVVADATALLEIIAREQDIEHRAFR